MLCKVTGLVPRPEGTTVEQVAQDLWEKTTWEDADNCLATNIAGSYFTFLAFLKLLGAGNEHPDSKWKGLVQSQFITNSSAGGLWRGEEPAYMYNASKSALINLTKNIATAFAKYRIRANTIAPGLFLTEINENDFSRDPDPKLPGSYPASWLPATRAGDDEVRVHVFQSNTIRLTRSRISQELCCFWRLGQEAISTAVYCSQMVEWSLLSRALTKH